jgi:hypothetical protein
MMRCPACDTPNPPEATRCEECGEKLPVRARRPVKEKEEEEFVEVRPVRRGPDTESRPARDMDDADDEDYAVRRPRKRRLRREEDEDDYSDDGGISILIPYKNPKALAGYYVGFFSLIPIAGLLLAPVAIVLCVLGIRDGSRNPKARGTVHAVVGLILAILSLLVVHPLLVVLIMWQLSKPTV